jgi:hypothetical protein
VVAYILGVELQELERSDWTRQTGLPSTLRHDSMRLENYAGILYSSSSKIDTAAHPVTCDFLGTC